MSHQVIDITCPGCGAPASTGETTCKYCHRPVIITTFNSVNDMPLSDLNKYASTYRKALADNPQNQELNSSVAMCFLKLKMYEKAAEAFEKAVLDNFDNSETFYYAAISLLGGKKAFLSLRPTIDKIEEYINAAIMIEPKGIYYYFLAYIKYDYFSRKYFLTSPTFQEALAMAEQAGLSPYDVEQLYNILGVSRPDSL